MSETVGCLVVLVTSQCEVGFVCSLFIEHETFYGSYEAYEHETLYGS